MAWQLLWWVIETPARALPAKLFVRIHDHMRFNAIRSVSGDKLSVMVGRLRGDSDGVYQEIVRDTLRRYFADKIEITLLEDFFGIKHGHEFDGEKFLDRDAQSFLTAKNNDLLIWGSVRGQNVLSLHFTTIKLDRPEGSHQYRLTELPTSFRLTRTFDLRPSFIKRFINVIDDLANHYPERLDQKIEAIREQLATGVPLSPLELALRRIDLGNLLTRLGEIEKNYELLASAQYILREALPALGSYGLDDVMRLANENINRIENERV